jgi:dihydroneopterin aldolase
LSDKITLVIEKLEFEAIIGLLESERQTPQRVEIWAKVGVDHKKKSMVDYVLIRDVIQESVINEKFFTIEEALLKISKKIGKISPRITKVSLKILKPSILQNAVVGVKIKKKFKKSKKNFKNS